MKNNEVRNPDGVWINVNYFLEARNGFLKDGSYCLEPSGTYAWYEFWQRERDRCLNGYSVGGVKITGDHYFHLNYAPMKIVKAKNAHIGEKIEAFPDFWDGDYNYFWIREIARNGIFTAMDKPYPENFDELSKEEQERIMKTLYDQLQMYYSPVLSDLVGGRDLIIGKSRRRGFSYKTRTSAACNYFHRPLCYTMFMAYEKKYLFPGDKTVFGKVMNTINFVNKYTAWTMPNDYIGNSSHIKASYKEKTNDGTYSEQGFLSEIECVSFCDNPDAGRGADAYDQFGEEAGAWGTPGQLLSVIAAMRSSSEAGSYKTGMMTLYGTSGSMDSGTVDFATIFNNPQAHQFMAFYDVWGDEKDKVEGFFFPKHLNTEGFYDENGNSDLEKAKNFELKKRASLIENGASNANMISRMQEEPLNSKEAFSMSAGNIFPSIEIQEQLNKIKIRKFHTDYVDLKYEKGKVIAVPTQKEPITNLYAIPNDITGCVAIYEHPKDLPKGAYKIGYDPIRHDTGTSLGAIVVYKSEGINNAILAAEYIGRPQNIEDIDRIAELLAIYYNTQIMYENEIPTVKHYFQKIKRLDLLCMQPDKIISKHIVKSRVSRIYGCHMTQQLKEAGVRYIREWLLSIIDYDENNNPIRGVDKIMSRRLLEELLAYTFKGNFDLVSALIMCMFQNEESRITVDKKNVDSTMKGLLTQYNNMRNYEKR